MPNALVAILGGAMTGAVSTPPPVYEPLPVRILEQPSVVNGGPLLHALPKPSRGCSEYMVSVHDTNYGQVRGKPSLSGRPLWRLVPGSNVTICSKNITTDESNIPWIWVEFRSQEEPWDHEGYMSFRILQPFVPSPVIAPPPPTAVASPPISPPGQQAPQQGGPNAAQVQPNTEERTTPHHDQTSPESEQKTTPKVIARTEDLPGQLPADVISVFSPIDAGMAGGTVCDKEIDIQVAIDFATARLGKRTFNLQNLIFTSWFAYAQQVLQVTLGAMPTTPAERVKYCADIMNAFGPSGETIPGLLKP
jgi:hypothetical protein